MKHGEQIGRVIRAYREAKNLSEEDLGFMMKLSQQQISRYENGKSAITFDNLIKISELLGIPFKKFFDGINIDNYLDEFRIEVSRHKDIINLIKTYPELKNIITLYGKNSKSLKDVDLLKLLTRLSQIPPGDRKILLNLLFKI